MSRLIDEMIHQSKLTAMHDVSVRMLKSGKYKIEDISYVSGLPMEEVLKFASELKREADL